MKHNVCVPVQWSELTSNVLLLEVFKLNSHKVDPVLKHDIRPQDNCDG